MTNERRTEEQEQVVSYLLSKGCRVKDRLNPKGYVEFEPIGASSFGGCVFQNGTVHIKNVHTAPFEEATTHYATIARERMGAAKFAVYWRDYMHSHDLETYEKLKKSVLDKAAKVDVKVDKDVSPVASQVWLLRDMMTPREKYEDFVKAIQDGCLRLTSLDSVINTIRSPGCGWMGRYNDMKSAKCAEDYDTLKGILKSQTPAMVQAQEFPTHRLVWLDVDAKENDASRFDVIRAAMMESDDRVASVFRTIGGGMAIGMGLYARTQLEYIAAMKKMTADIQSDYGIVIDQTCWRWQQLRLLSYDPDISLKPTVRHYRSDTMNIDELQQMSDKITSTIEKSVKQGSRKKMRAADSMLSELDYAMKALQIEVVEDVWTGKRTYHLQGHECEKIDSLWLAIKDLELRDNNNCWRIAKDDAIGYMTANAVKKHDVVMETVFDREWDGVNRWEQLQKALHLDSFQLIAWQMWMRQGVGLLENCGNADDLQRNFMLILYSKGQSIGKSHLVRQMSCGTNSFTQKNLDMKSKDTLADLYSHWIHEFGELGTTFRRKDINDLKNYVTNTAVAIRRPYDRDATTYPVRTSIIGTTNDCDLFTDDTGNRRYIVIDCKWTREDWNDIDAIDFKELWRQSKAEYEIERTSKNGLYPYQMSLDFQNENDVRCKGKIVRTREMYAVAQILMSWKDGSTDAIERDDMDVYISMAKLLAQLDAWGVHGLSEYNLKRAFKMLGFNEYQTVADTVFIIDNEAYDALRADVSATMRKPKNAKSDNVIQQKINDAIINSTEQDPVIVNFD